MKTIETILEEINNLGPMITYLRNISIIIQKKECIYIF